MEHVRVANSIEELGVPEGLVEDLFMRRAVAERSLTVGDAAEALCVSHRVGMQVAELLRGKAMVEYLGATGRDYRIQPTELGYRATAQLMASGRHVGPVPVPLATYVAVVEAQTIEPVIDRDTMSRAFGDLIIDDLLLDQIGPAFASGGAIFLYGPAGTGKTSLAERLNRVVEDPVLIPRHVEVDGQLIAIYDPALHRALPEQPADVDRRWVLCERPLVVVGGELDRPMLDLRHDTTSGVSHAPVQMLANNGILVVDDFGRQAVRPEEILNRWILPLSRGVDHLTAHTGSKFSIPFQLKLVISTNLDPRSLGDDAFLRRLRNKVFVGPITDAAFSRVLEGAAKRYEVELDPGAADYLIKVSNREIGELRPYLAVDFCELARAVCGYHGETPRLDADSIERVAELYFVQEEAEQMQARPLDVWSLPVSAEHAVGPAWSDYQIGGYYSEDPLAGLDALARTQSIETDDGPIGVPSVLRSGDEAAY